MRALQSASYPYCVSSLITPNECSKFNDLKGYINNYLHIELIFVMSIVPYDCGKN